MRLASRLLVILLLLLAAYAGFHYLRGQPAPACQGVGCDEPAEEIARLPTLTATSTPLPTPTAIPPTSTAMPSPTEERVVAPFGSIVLEDGSAATPTPRPVIIRESDLIEQYGERTFRSTEEMPADLAYYFTTALDEVASYFEVRPEDLEALLRVQNEGRLRIHRPAGEGESIRGVARMPARLWSGWAAPSHDRYLLDPRSIEQYGGLGFDWGARSSWESWREGRLSMGVTVGLNANPDRFYNALSALARYLVQNGLTRRAALRDPDRFERALDAALVPFEQEMVSGKFHAALLNPDAVPVSPEDAAPLRAAFEARMDRGFAVRLSEADRVSLVDSSPIALAVLNGELDSEAGAARLLEEITQQFLAEGARAREEGLPRPWPFVENETQLAAQQLAVQRLGHTLAPWDLDAVLEEAGGDLAAVGALLEGRAEASLFAEARQMLDEGLQRSARGLPLRVHEVTSLLQPVLAPYNTRWLGRSETRLILGDVEYLMRRMAEFRDLNGDLFFSATPFDPMPDRVLQPFGVPARYQPGGYHTGVDLRVRRGGAQQPPLYAVEAGTVAHVGPLYCNQEGLCRGPYAIILDHGRNIYTIYSHNSEATVRPGDVVQAGQMIGRQGNLGYSRGPHLHLEVHVGAPYSGDWTEPWRGGEFVDPWPWLPRELSVLLGN